MMLLINEAKIGMLSRCKTFSRYSKILKVFDTRRPSSLTILQGLQANNYLCVKYFGNSSIRRKKDEVPSVFSKYELFSEETAPVILDVEEERQKIAFDDKLYEEFDGVNLERGVTGVFDIEEIVEILKKERSEDTTVFKIPPEFNYADYMVIVSARSSKHMTAILDFVRRLYKRKVGSSGHIPKLEGTNSNIWKAIDLGNIVLHVFSKKGRKVYDLETLWCVGKEFDNFSQKSSTSNLFTDYAKILANLSPKT